MTQKKKEFIISGSSKGKINVFVISKKELKRHFSFDFKMSLLSFKIFQNFIFLADKTDKIYMRKFSLPFQTKKQQEKYFFSDFEGESEYAYDFLKNSIWGINQGITCSILTAQNYLNFKKTPISSMKKRLSVIHTLDSKQKLIFGGEIRYLGMLNCNSAKLFRRIKYFFKSRVEAIESFQNQNLFVCISSEPKLGIFSSINNWKTCLSLYGRPTAMSLSGSDKRILLGGQFSSNLLTQIDVRVKNIRSEKIRILKELKTSSRFQFLFGEN